MICPNCDSDMIVVEHEGLELDYCINCHGIWFDKGELDWLLESLGLEKTGSYLEGFIEAEEAITNEQKRRCPLCRFKMKKVNLETKVLVDICPRGEGVWFDGDEVRTLVKHLTLKVPKNNEVQHNVLKFIGKVLKHNDVLD